jgi:hypothetical protein
VFSAIVGAIGSFFTSAWNGVVTVFTAAATWFNNTVIQPIIGVFSAIVGAVGGFFTEAWNKITGIFGAVSEWFGARFTEAWEKIKSIFAPVGEFFGGMWEKITGLFGKIGTAIGDAVSGAFKSVVNAILTFAENRINGFINGINTVVGIVNNLPGVNIKTISPLEIPKLAKGSNYTPETFIAGERGAELITNASGRKVFTALSNSNSVQNIRYAQTTAQNRLDTPQIKPLTLSQAAVTNNNTSNSRSNASPTFSFSPNITVNGGGNDTAEQIRAAIADSMPGFMAQVQNMLRDEQEKAVRMAYA